MLASTVSNHAIIGPKGRRWFVGVCVSEPGPVCFISPSSTRCVTPRRTTRRWDPAFAATTPSLASCPKRRGREGLRRR